MSERTFAFPFTALNAKNTATFRKHALALKNVPTALASSIALTIVTERPNASPAETAQLIPAPPPPARPSSANAKPSMNAIRRMRCHTSLRTKSGPGHLRPLTRLSRPLHSLLPSSPTSANALFAPSAKPPTAPALGIGPHNSHTFPNLNLNPANRITVGLLTATNPPSWVYGARNP
jgi:hypothetical protein